MDFAFTPDQESLRSAARDWLANRWPIDRVVSIIDARRGFDAAAWHELASLGWLDEDLTLLDQAVLAEESGAALLPLPWWSSIALAAPALDAELRSAVAAGDRAVTLAWAEPGRSHAMRDAASASTVSVGGDGGLTGTKVLVPDLAVVTDVVVVTADGLYAVDVVAHPEVVVRRDTIDRSRPLGELRLDATPARRLDTDPAVVADDCASRAVVLACCEAVGVAQRALDLTAAYTKERQQFGRVIGTYQGVSHRVSNTYVATQLARSMAYWAAWAVDCGDDGAGLAVAAAKSNTGDAAIFACEQAIQAHGGIGFTWEHALHRFYKRAQWIDGFDRTGRACRAEIAAGILDASPTLEMA